MEIENIATNIKRATWKPATHYNGRNGFGHVGGIEVINRGSAGVAIQPVTSRGEVTDSCRIVIPNDPDKIRAVARMLDAIAEQI